MEMNKFNFNFTDINELMIANHILKNMVSDLTFIIQKFTAENQYSNELNYSQKEEINKLFNETLIEILCTSKNNEDLTYNEETDDMNFNEVDILKYIRES